MTSGEARPALLLLVALLTGLPQLARGEPVAPPPPRLPASPRYFGRSARPVEPETSLSLGVGSLWAPEVQGVRSRQGSLALLGSLALGRLGLYFELPLVADWAFTESVYGEARDRATGVGDLGFGAELRLGRGTWRNVRWALAVVGQVTAPTGGAPVLQPATAELPAPLHRLATPRWTASLGASLAARPRAFGSLQLDAELIAHWLRLEPWELAPGERETWLFGGLRATWAYPIQRWLIALLEVEAQLELRGAYSLRQLLFLVPALRLQPVPRVAIDLAARAPLRDEAWQEQRLTLAVTICVALDREASGAR